MSVCARCVAAFALAGLLGCGVGGYNTYATPRTVPKGQLKGELTVHGAGFAGEIGGQKRRVIMPILPGYGLRRGLTDGLDLGLRAGVALFTLEAGSEIELGTDLRLKLVDGEAIELALGPGVRYAHLSGVSVANTDGYLNERGLHFFTFDAPVITGINLDETLAVVLSTGIVYDLRTSDVTPEAAAIDGRFARGLSPRVALGLHDDAGRYAVHPEASLVFVTGEPDQRIIYTVGVAFEFRWWRPPHPAKVPPKVDDGRKGPYR